MCIEKDRYIIHVDVKFFSPEELSVNIGDEFITVNGKHEGRQVRGTIEICRNSETKLIRWQVTHILTLILFPGWPRLCVKRVFEEIQASCWSVKCWCQRQSVIWWYPYNHCTSVMFRLRAPYSCFLWRWNTKTENVEQSLTLLTLFHY